MLQSDCSWGQLVDYVDLVDLHDVRESTRTSLSMYATTCLIFSDAEAIFSPQRVETSSTALESHHPSIWKHSDVPFRSRSGVIAPTLGPVVRIGF